MTASPLHVVIVGWGSSGDVLPMITIGGELRRRGHVVTFVGNGYFSSAARAESLRVVEVGAAADHERLMNDSGVFGEQRKSWEAIYAEHYYPLLDNLYEAIEATLTGDSTVLIGEEAAAAAIAAARRIPRVHAAPSSARFFSRYDPPHPEQHLPRRYRWLTHTPAGLALFYRLHHLRHGVTAWPSNVRPLPPDHPVSRIRARAGLAPDARPAADLTLCMWPEWFAAPRRDWPKGAVIAGFPLRQTTAPPSGPEAPDMAAGAIIATTGSSAGSQHQFYSTVTAACAQLQLPGLLVSPHTDHIPTPLPASVRHVRHVAFDYAFRRAALVIHHGGIGTAAIALAAGLPQIVVPRRGDQFDNGNRLVRLGVAVVRPLDAMSPTETARTILDVVNSSRIRERCRLWQARVAEQDGVVEAANHVEQLAWRRFGTPVTSS